MALRIDAHHHLWKYSPEEYGWIGEGMGALRRDFLPGDLEAELRVCGIDGAIAVQARQTLEETEWLLELAESSPVMRGVVGWVPLAGDGFTETLEGLLARPKLKGLRHVIQDEPDAGFMRREDFNRGVGLIGDRLVYDILIYERQLPQAIELVDRHPGQRFVLDHLAKPRIGEGQLEPWATGIREMARRRNVWCKLSGMVTEADWQRWSVEGLRPYFDTVLEAFGPGRLLYGSDWPVCLLAADYGRWFGTVETLVGGLSAEEQAQILGRNAVEVYRL